MTDLQSLIRKALQHSRVMQLASSSDNKPWVCNVHFYSDDDMNIYWISTPERRHSLDIAKNPFVAATIKVHEDTPDEQYVIGLSFEGKAERISDAEMKKIGRKYSNKLGKPTSLLQDIESGKNPHRFYKMTPTTFVLFDNKHFPDNPRQEFKLH